MTGQAGPWATGYVFPDATGGTPPPPAATPPQATPQPPVAAPDPTQPPSTLGQTNQAMQPSEVRQRFNDYLQLTQAANAAAQRDYLPESSKPGLLANLLTFGMAGAMDADYRRAYNAAIDRHNSGLNALAAKQALDMTTQDMKSAHGDIGTQIALMRLQMQRDQNEINNVLKEYGLDLRTRTFERGNLVEGPKTPEERAAHADIHEKWIPDPTYPNRGRWTYMGPNWPGGGQTDAGTAGGRGGGDGNVVPIRPRPPAPGSPLGNELGVKPSGGGAAGGAAAPPTRPEEMTTEQLNAQKRAEAAQGEVETARQMNLNEVQTQGSSIVDWLNAPDFDRAINNVLPSKETVGQTGGAAQYFNPWVMKARGAVGDKQTIQDVQYIKSGLKNIVPAIRSMAAGSKGMRINIPEIELLGQQWKRLAAGQMNREEAAAFKKTFIKVYNQVVTGLGGKAVGQESETSTTSTPSGTPATTPPSSVPTAGGGLPTSGTTRGGVTWRQVTP